MEEIQIETQVIKLDQFLKFIGVAQTGGHAKMIIEDEVVSINGEICIQRGKKLSKGDTVQIDMNEYKII